MRNRYHISSFRFVLPLVFLLLAQQVSAQFFYGLQQTFGKNRVQYNDFEWVFYRFERFDVYFYRGNEDLAEQVARMTDKNLPQIEKFLDAPLDERVQILVFNNLSDLKQSNVNSNEDEDYNTSGITRISGRRLFVYFDGDYTELESHLRSGLTEVVLSNLIYGSFTESIKNSTLLNLPEWYMEGLISYMGESWNTDIDTRVRDGILSGKYKKINSLMQDDARYAGHSMWYYIDQTYGKKVIKNILYLSIIHRNIENGFTYILGKNLKEIQQGWLYFYGNRYGTDQSALAANKAQQVFLKAPKGYVITQMASSEDGRYLAYVCQKFSEYKLYIYDFEREKRKKILKGGYKIAQNTDYSFPLLSWHPNNEILAFFTEEEGFIYLNFYNLKDKKLEKKTFFKFDKILSFEYSEDGKRFLLSAVKNGQSDIFLYNILNTKVEQITNDSYNDLYPSFFDGNKRIVFSSNRFTDTLKQGEKSDRFAYHHDLFAMEAKEPEDTTVIWRMTNSPGIEELKAQEYEPGYLSFLSNRSGIQNRHLIQIDSSIAYVDTTTHYEYSFKEYRVTDLNRNLLGNVFAPERDLTLNLVYEDRRYRLLEETYLSPEELSLRQVNSSQAGQPSEAAEESEALSQDYNDKPLYYPGVKTSDFEINIDDYRFNNEEKIRGKGKGENEAKEPAEPLQIQPVPEAITSFSQAREELKIPPKRNYFLSFYQDDFSASFGNAFDNPQYQRFTGFVSGDLLNSGFNMQFKVGALELMHDYRLIGGMRTNFQPLSGTSLTPNAEYIIALLDYKKRLDKTYIFSRRSQVQFIDPTNYQRIITHEGTARFSWPFSPVSSIRADLGYRLDRTITLSREQTSLDNPDFYQDYLVSRLAYVYDNTRKIGINLYAGLRYKIFFEYYRNLNTSPTGLYNTGIDLRQYTVIHRNLIWANRFASGFSFGPQKLIYFMGGVDNQFAPQFNPDTRIATENNYIFQTLATNMRGFFQNIRNGNNFALINTEIRWPIFSYLASRPLRSDFFKNFQIVGFGDIGTAWNGPSPYAPENAINTNIVDFGGLRVELDSQKEPIVASYGVGIRTRLFGYYVRVDLAWGVEDGIFLPHVWHISLGTDF